MGDDVPAFMEFLVMTYRVLVCDDEPEVGRNWWDDIQRVLPPGIYHLEPVPSRDDIKNSIQSLLHRRAATGTPDTKTLQPCVFDDADILVIDYDLVHVDETRTRYTGEGVARLARAFCDCGLIVVLNQYVETQFDLGLRGHFESFADLNIDGRLVGVPGLWREGPWTEFRPWHWPVLHKAVDQFRRRVEYLTDPLHLSAGILQTFRMTKGDAEYLSDTAFGLLAPTAESYDQIARWTFADFLKDNSAAVETRHTITAIADDAKARARLVASRVAKWLEREVLGPQDVLVDIPHLIQRCPFLLRGERSNLDTWNQAVYAGREVLEETVPAHVWFAADDWLSRPAVWWHQLEAHQPFRDARSAFDYGIVPDFVFLEDASCFEHIDGATEFRADFHNIYDRRYLKRFNEIRYAPQRRLAFSG